MIFKTLFMFAAAVLATFVLYVWGGIIAGKPHDHMLLWLLAAFPLALMLILMRLSSEPREEDKLPTGTVADLFKEALAVAKEYVVKKFS
ncbi:hypothetical protein [Pelagibacterium sp.]|uniref:hypothetical protein n=1 Tax=Pelagibacterium sp. TaxID=1967288 RepID=UPI003A8CAB37